MSKLVEAYLNQFDADVELNGTLQKWHESETRATIKSTKDDIDQICILLALVKKSQKDTKPYEIAKKRVMRLLSYQILQIGDKKKEKKQLGKEERNMSDIDPTIPQYSYEEAVSFLISSQRKVERLRSINQLENVKQKKLKDLLDICEALSSVQSKEVKIKLLLREKLLQILDALVMNYGGVGFLAPLDIPANASLGALSVERHWDEIEFAEYTWSTSTGVLVEEMKLNGLSAPRLTRSPLFRQVCLSKRFRFLEGDKIVLPEGHFTMRSVLLVPIVVNKQTVCVLGLSNGNYTQQDAEIVFEILPKMWTNVIIDSVSKANKKQEDTERLKSIEQRVELGKKLILGLSNILKNDGDIFTTMTRDKILKKKITDIADFLEDRYGGMAFVAPLEVEMNIALLQLTKDSSASSSTSASESESDRKKKKERFLNYQFSKSATQVRKTIMKDQRKPILAKAGMMLETVRTMKPILISDTSKLKLPPGHFPLTSALLVPICINEECVALVGLANGKFTETDGEVLYDVLSTSWFTILRECFARLDSKQNEDQKKLKRGFPDIRAESVKGIQKNVKLDSVTIVSIVHENTGEFSKIDSVVSYMDYMTNVYNRFDSLTASYKLMKISTNSDVYTVCAGLNGGLKTDTVGSALAFAISITEELTAINKSDFTSEVKKYFPIKLKIVVSTGSAVGGIIGSTEIAQYDLFGDAVEISRHLLNRCGPNEILINSKSLDPIKQMYDYTAREDFKIDSIIDKSYLIKGRKLQFSGRDID